MSWHDLIDDSSVRHFVSPEGSWILGDEVVAATEQEVEEEPTGVNGGEAVDVTEPPSTNSDNASAATDLSDSGITIVPSVPSSRVELEQSGVVVEREIALFLPEFGTNHHLSTELSLNPSSVASSVLTEDDSLGGSMISEISSVATGRSASRSVVSADDDHDYNTASTIDEEQIRALYMQQNATEQSWEENKDRILEVLHAVEADHKDSDCLLAQLYEEEEALFEQLQRRRSQSETIQRVFDTILTGSFLGLAAAVAIRILRQR